MRNRKPRIWNHFVWIIVTLSVSLVLTLSIYSVIVGISSLILNN